MKPVELNTERVLLRQWQAEDYTKFADLNGDPQVMEFFPSTRTREESDAMANRCHSLIAEHGWGFWAAELRVTGEFMGFIGLHTTDDYLPFAPGVEIGWRLARSFWGKGYASEGARAAMRFAFEQLTLEQVLSFTPVLNLRSKAVMERLGMVDSGHNFEHPAVPVGSRLCEHVLYKLNRAEFQRTDSR